MNDRRLRYGAGLLLLTLAAGPAALACSSFSLLSEGRVLFGKNYDWSLGDGLLLVNPRGVERTADLRPPETPARWTAGLGSVTFNQYGRDFPSGGINEAGLVVELMWLDGTTYPEPDDRPALGCLQWIQYQLDRQRTVADVLASDAAVRIRCNAPLHFLVADAQGDAATVEFLDGRRVAHHGQSLPVAALTNDRYDRSLRHALDQGPGGGVGSDRSSLGRFAILARRLADALGAGKADPVGYAFDTLAGVAQPSSTQWSIVYEQDRRRVHFRTRDHAAIRSLALEDLDFACAAGSRALDLQRAVAGDVSSHLEPTTRELNLRLIRTSYAGTPFLRGVPDAELQRVARVPEQARCAANPDKPDGAAAKSTPGTKLTMAAEEDPS